MLTVTQLARECGLSRSTVLYYESIGLLPRPARSMGNYRKYNESQLARLRQVCSYRSAGLKLADIPALLGRPKSGEAIDVLKRRLAEIGRDIERLKDHQRAILRLLQHPTSIDRRRNMTKDKWVAIMRSAGFKEEEMHRWHKEFESAAPDDHQEFLEYLHIPKEEIDRIRDWSRKGAKG